MSCNFIGRIIDREQRLKIWPSSVWLAFSLAKKRHLQWKGLTGVKSWHEDFCWKSWKNLCMQVLYRGEFPLSPFLRSREWTVGAGNSQLWQSGLVFFFGAQVKSTRLCLNLLLFQTIQHCSLWQKQRRSIPTLCASRRQGYLVSGSLCADIWLISCTFKALTRSNDHSATSYALCAVWRIDHRCLCSSSVLLSTASWGAPPSYFATAAQTQLPVDLKSAKKAAFLLCSFARAFSIRVPSYLLTKRFVSLGRILLLLLNTLATPNDSSTTGKFFSAPRSVQFACVAMKKEDWAALFQCQMISRRQESDTWRVTRKSCHREAAHVEMCLFGEKTPATTHRWVDLGRIPAETKCFRHKSCRELWNRHRSLSVGLFFACTRLKKIKDDKKDCTALFTQSIDVHELSCRSWWRRLSLSVIYSWG